MVVSFQSRVSVITEAIAAAAEELIHVLGVIVMVIILFAVQAHILFGNRMFAFSDLSNSLFFASSVFLDRNITSRTYMMAVQAASESSVWDDNWNKQQGLGVFHDKLQDFQRAVVAASGVIFFFVSQFLLFIIISSLIVVFEVIRKKKKVLGHQNSAIHDLREVVWPNFVRWVRESLQANDGTSSSREASNLTIRNLLR